MEVFLEYIEGLAGNWEIQAANEFGKEIFGLTKVFLTKDQSPLIERLVITEMISMIPVSITMPVFRVALEKEFHWDCKELADDTIKGKTSSAGKQSPLRVRQAISEFKRKFKIEKKLEGKVVTAPWFVREEMERLFLLALIDTCLIFEPRSIWSRLPLGAEKKIDSKILTLNRIRLLELSKRMSGHIKSVLKEIEHVQVFGEVKSENENLSKKLNSLATDYLWLHEESVNDIAESLTGTYDIQRSESEADYFGLGLQIVLDGLFDAAIKRDGDNIKKLFPNAILAAEAARLRVVKLVADAAYLQSAYKAALEPFVDLLFISSVVYILSEIDKNSDIKKIVLGIWTGIINGNNDLEKIEILTKQFKAYKSIIAITGQQMRRFNWNKKIEEILREKGIVTEPAYSNPFMIRNREEENVHGKLLGAVALALHSHIDLSEVFLIAAFEELGGVIDDDNGALDFSYYWKKAGRGSNA